jgi:hypothetical protein
LFQNFRPPLNLEKKFQRAIIMTEARDFFQGKIFMVRSISSKNFRILEVSVDFIIEKQISERGGGRNFWRALYKIQLDFGV